MGNSISKERMEEALKGFDQKVYDQTCGMCKKMENILINSMGACVINNLEVIGADVMRM